MNSIQFNQVGSSVPTTQPAFIEWQNIICRNLLPPKSLGQKAKSNHLGDYNEPPIVIHTRMALFLRLTSLVVVWGVCGRKAECSELDSRCEEDGRHGWWWDDRDDDDAQHWVMTQMITNTTNTARTIKITRTHVLFPASTNTVKKN